MKEKERKKGKNGERGELIGFENTCSKLKREQKSLSNVRYERIEFDIERLPPRIKRDIPMYNIYRRRD